MQKLVNRVVQIARTGEIEYAELQGASMALCWGVGLLFVSAPALQVPPYAIGAALLVVAVMQLWGIRGIDYAWRRAGALTAVVVWTFVAGEALDAGNTWRHVVCPTCIMFAVAAGWGYYRIGRRQEARLLMGPVKT